MSTASYIYVNDLEHASKIMKPTMFADDTDLFYFHKDLKLLFKIVNNEKRNNCIKANKFLMLIKQNTHK